MFEENCIFCKIAKLEAPAYIVWEDNDHIAFLSRAPNTEGVTVVIPRHHYSSYIFDSTNDVMNNLMIASKKVAKILEQSFEDVGRIAVVFEGYGINHLHAKLFPMHGTIENEWKPISSNINTYFEKYSGYISSHDFRKITESQLENTLSKIQSFKNK
jgi:histidine triad (HIT) family protein